MIRKVFFLFVSVSFLFANPYNDISIDEKLNLLTNYFLNETLKNKLPQIPQVGKPKEHEYNYEPTKYELYYNYVQRIKAIEESIKQEKKELSQKYKADIYKYNTKVDLLRKKYQQHENLSPLIEEAFNKSLKVIYGKPILKLQNGTYGQQFFLSAEPIYYENKFSFKGILFNNAQEKRMFYFYENCELIVTFAYAEQNAVYDEVICKYNQKEYRGTIVQEDKEKIKLNIKINDDIFHKIDIEDK